MYVWNGAGAKARAASGGTVAARARSIAGRISRRLVSGLALRPNIPNIRGTHPPICLWVNFLLIQE